MASFFASTTISLFTHSHTPIGPATRMIIPRSAPMLFTSVVTSLVFYNLFFTLTKDSNRQRQLQLGWLNTATQANHSLVPKYGIEPLVEHYACMVGVLSRAEKIFEVVEIVNEMPIKPTAKVSGALLNWASGSSDLELGKFICNHLFEMESEIAGNYMAMANLYSKVGRWEEAEDVRGKMDEVGLKKIVGNSWIQTHPGFLYTLPK